MILWKFKERINENAKAFRWVLETSLGTHGGSFGLVCQYQDADNKWRSSHTNAFEIAITNQLKFGSEHWWYDGPHYEFSLGFIHFYWGGNPWTRSCSKCLKDENENSI